MAKVRFDDLLRFAFPSRPRFSPDGTQAAYLLTRANKEKNGYDRDLWLYDFRDGSDRRLTFSGEERVFTWARDGRSIYFVSKRGGEKEGSAVYRLRQAGGEASPVGVIPQPVGDLRELPDGRFLVKAVYTPEEPNPENANYAVYTQIPFYQNGLGFTGQRRTALALWTPQNSELKRLTPDFMDVQTWALSRDGRKAVITAIEYTSVMPVLNHVYELDIETGGIVCLSAGLEYSFRAAGRCGDRLIVVASDNKSYGTREYPKIFELKDGAMTCLTPDLDTSFQASLLNDCSYGIEPNSGRMDDAGVVYISTDGIVSRLYLNDLNGKNEVLTPGLTSADDFDFADGRALVIGMRGLQLEELYLIDPDDTDQMVQLTHHNDWTSEEFELSQPVHHLVDNGEGVLLDAWHLKPVDFEEGKKYPTILSVHGGPNRTFGEVFFHEMQCWAALGYVVLFMNPRGSDGRGSEFGDIRGHFGQGDYRDVMAVVDWAVANLDFVDADRMGVTGGSYGGYMTNWIVSHTDRFKCAASQRGICNWITLDGVCDIGYHFGVDQQAGSAPWTDPSIAWEASPLKHVKNVKTPMLFIHSEQDYRCPSEQAFQFFTALQLLGVETRLCYFSGENHGLSRSGRPTNRLARLREITSWMDRFLKD